MENCAVGDPTRRITGAASLSEAVPGEVTFYADPRYLARLRKTRASAIFVPLDFSEQTAAAQIRVANPSKAFEQVVLKLAPKPIEFAPGVHPTAVVDPSCETRTRCFDSTACRRSKQTRRIGDNTVIGAGSYVGHETVIGTSCANLSERDHSRTNANWRARHHSQRRGYRRGRFRI